MNPILKLENGVKITKTRKLFGFTFYESTQHACGYHEEPANPHVMQLMKNEAEVVPFPVTSGGNDNGTH